MTSRHKLLFYDDVPNLGGHELMVAALVGELDPARYELIFVLHPANLALKRVLQERCPHIQLLEFSYRSGKGQLYRTYLAAVPIIRLVGLMKDQSADLLIVVQGGAALSSIGLVAGRLAGVRTLSYIPMTHPESIFTASKIKALVRTMLVRPLLNLPNLTVTISERMAGYLQRSRSGPVVVVENGIKLPTANTGTREQARRDVGIGADETVFGLFGRIEFWQKRQDLALEAFSNAVQQRRDLRFLIVGDGPDAGLLKSRCADLGLGTQVVVLPWQTDMRALYDAVDYLLIPSRYEGVPLVMLEAMFLRRKVIASDVDGMADMLPAHWLFPEGDVRALARRMVSPGGLDDSAWIERHHQLVKEEYTLKAFGQRFRKVIDHELALA